MRYAIILDGIVSNVVESDTAPENGIQTDIASPGWIFNDGVFQDPQPVLNNDYQIRNKYMQIIHERNKECFLPVHVNNHLWQADAKSQLLLTQAISLAQAGLPLPAVWRDADNNDVAITDIAQLLAIAAAIAAQTQAAYERSWQRKAALDAATTLEEIEAITW